jgi:hypothetical protein
LLKEVGGSLLHAEVGTPEGWYALGLNLKTRERVPMDGCVHDTLKNAKIAAETNATALFGRGPTQMKWH